MYRQCPGGRSSIPEPSTVIMLPQLSYGTVGQRDRLAYWGSIHIYTDTSRPHMLYQYIHTGTGRR